MRGSPEQDTDPQLGELRAAGCATVLEEHARAQTEAGRCWPACDLCWWGQRGARSNNFASTGR
jgi:hypothetical protein